MKKVGSGRSDEEGSEWHTKSNGKNRHCEIVYGTICLLELNSENKRKVGQVSATSSGLLVPGEWVTDGVPEMSRSSKVAEVSRSWKGFD
jgi:hypothetical protein